MVNKPRIKGTTAETAVVSFLRTHGWQYAERLALQGKLDKGDITGTPGIAWEVKNYAQPQWPTWFREAEYERINARAAYAVVVAKPPGVGVLNTGSWWAGMLKGGMDILIAQAGMRETQIARVGLMGARINKGLVESMRAARMQAQQLGIVEIYPKGVKERTSWYNITTLDQMTRLLRAAGYGDPEVIHG